MHSKTGKASVCIVGLALHYAHPFVITSPARMPNRNFTDWRSKQPDVHIRKANWELVMPCARLARPVSAGQLPLVTGAWTDSSMGTRVQVPTALSCL